MFLSDSRGVVDVSRFGLDVLRSEHGSRTVAHVDPDCLTLGFSVGVSDGESVPVLVIEGRYRRSNRLIRSEINISGVDLSDVVYTVASRNCPAL